MRKLIFILAFCLYPILSFSQSTTTTEEEKEQIQWCCVEIYDSRAHFYFNKEEYVLIDKETGKKINLKNAVVILNLMSKLGWEYKDSSGNLGSFSNCTILFAKRIKGDEDFKSGLDLIKID